ncbi:MAG: hypothetical protein JWQ89_964 [Devosia sp.]|uniref:hypothetical protein n=1 Tax=Devosia sp. TaxID=1871048 RepID=UPI00260F851A|nr:hypothetical protein [Devosia sp.]MDB5539237.1 hypothetical protein [Devosia sp.]
MTLVVARSNNGRIAIAADTLLSEHGGALPIRYGALKSVCLPGNVCASYSGSPELAARSFSEYLAKYPRGTSYGLTIDFFEKSSKDTNNDYIVAFADTGRLTTIRDGRRTSGVATLHWVGDKRAFERFREHEFRKKRRQHHGRAVNAVLFADEMEGSPASELYSTMREVVLDRDIDSVGGFVTVLSNRDLGFRFSVYSDVLLDWPAGPTGECDLRMEDTFDLNASGENERFSVSQVSPGYYNCNCVAFYVLKGGLLYVLQHSRGGEMQCIQGVPPSRVADAIDGAIGFPFGALSLVMSSRPDGGFKPRSRPEQGVQISLFCELNTMPVPASGTGRGSVTP